MMKALHSNAITLSEAKSALLRSGYLLENRVEQLLLEKDYYVEANTVYPDPLTQKSREFDLQATKSHLYKGRFGSWVRSTLFVECINNPQPIAFITKELPYPKILLENIKFNGLPKQVKYDDPKLKKLENKDFWLPIEDFLEMQKYHHYCSNKIATQFCSFIKKKNSNEWMAFHEDSHFESLQKLCDVTGHHLENMENGWKANNLSTVSFNFFYPLIVVQGELMEVKVNKKRGLSFHKTKHVQFLRTTIQQNEPTIYQIDVITELYLPKYLMLIEEEMIETMKRIKENIDVMNNAIKEITKIGF